MIDGNAVFDVHGVANLGSGIVLRRSGGIYTFNFPETLRDLSQDDVYTLGTALARLTGGGGAGLVKSQ